MLPAWPRDHDTEDLTTCLILGVLNGCMGFRRDGKWGIARSTAIKEGRREGSERIKEGDRGNGICFRGVILAFQAHTDWTMDVEAATRNFNSNDVALDTYRKILSARSRNGRSLDFQYGAASNTSYSFCEALYIRSTCA
jgi:hypothetical protein